MVNTGSQYVNPDRVVLGECTRKEIREALQRGKLKAAIIPIGATEQHNEHLRPEPGYRPVHVYLSAGCAATLPTGHCCPALSGRLLPLSHGAKGHPDAA